MYVHLLYSLSNLILFAWELMFLVKRKNLTNEFFDPPSPVYVNWRRTTWWKTDRRIECTYPSNSLGFIPVSTTVSIPDLENKQKPQLKKTDEEAGERKTWTITKNRGEKCSVQKGKNFTFDETICLVVWLEGMGPDCSDILPNVVFARLNRENPRIDVASDTPNHCRTDTFEFYKYDTAEGHLSFLRVISWAIKTQMKLELRHLLQQIAAQ